MSDQMPKPTRRQERRTQTVQEIKTLAMQQVSTGGPEAVSLSGIVREMSMSPAAVYRYFASRDALLADLVVDAYNDFADSALEAAADRSDPRRHMGDVLHAARTWALANPNAYRLIFQTSIGSGQELDPQRTIPAASRSMTTIVEAIAAVAAAAAETGAGPEAGTDTDSAVTPTSPALDSALEAWAKRSELSQYSHDVLLLGLTSWTRLHGIMSLELGGHLPATGIDSALLYDAEVESICELAELAGRR